MNECQLKRAKYDFKKFTVVRFQPEPMGSEEMQDCDWFNLEYDQLKSRFILKNIAPNLKLINIFPL